MNRLFYFLYPYIAYPWDSCLANYRKISSQKVFCIGLNKTGTTSIELTLAEMGYEMGTQRKGELLLHDWFQGNYKRIIKFCETAEAFQDSPFSLPNTYKALDQHFPDAKFILTIRDTPEQWYDSLTRFHSKLFADGKRIPTLDDLKAASYIRKGRLHRTLPLIFKSPPEDIYNKEILLNYYATHNEAVATYFSNRPNKLLIINTAQPKDYSRLCDFLNKKPLRKGFPWLNKT